jgi:hypothetical protein
MTSWRDSASELAQADLDGLLSAVLPFAQQQLEKRDGFLPFGATVSTDGELRMTAADVGEHPGSLAVLDALYAGVRTASNSTRAAAFVVDVKAGGGDAIRVELEHVEGPTMAILMPYARSRFRGTITYAELQAGTSQPHVW